MAEILEELDTIPDYFGIQIWNLTNVDSDNGNSVTSLIITNALFMGLVVLFIAARVYAKVYLAGRFQADDFLIIFATAVSLTCSGILLYSIRLGLGHHIWDQGHLTEDPRQFHATISVLTKLLHNGAGILYSCALNLAKISIVIFYIRVFPIRWFRLFLYALGSLLAASFALTLFIIVFQCDPVQAAWDWTIQNAHCMNILVFLESIAGFNVSTNLILVLAPIPMLWNLELTRAEKASVIMLISLGLGACSASILRVIKIGDLKCFDITYNAVQPLLSSIVEVDVAIICSCIASMRPILTHHFPSIGIFSRSLVAVNELEHNMPEASLKNHTFTTTNRIFSSYSSESIPNTGYAYNNYRPVTPESPRTVKRDWAFDSINSSSTRDTFSADPVNWDDYWKRNARDDIGAPIDRDIRRKVELEGLQKAHVRKEASSSRQRLSFSNFIPMDTFRRPSATSSHKSRDDDKEKDRDLQRQQSN